MSPLATVCNAFNSWVVFYTAGRMYEHRGGEFMLIALNPGHFPGMDPGAVSADGVEEATLVRAVGRVLQVI